MDGELNRRWKEFIIKPWRSLNQHLTDKEWEQVLRLHPPPNKCLFTGLKPYKKESLYSAHCVSWPKLTRGKANLGCHKIAALVGYDYAHEVRDLRPEMQITMVMNNGQIHLQQNWHASHWYCHNEACVNPLHILPEANIVNQERNTCKRHVICTPGYRCPHYPTCIGLKPCMGGDHPVKANKEQILLGGREKKKQKIM
jgi:hypothetical protein